MLMANQAPSTLTKEQVLNWLLAWLAQGYATKRIPVGLVKRALVAAVNVNPQVVDEAIQAALNRGLLRRDGSSEDGIIVSLTKPGMEQGASLLQHVEGQTKYGTVTGAAEQLIKTLVTAYEETLRKVAKEWATEAGSDVEPIHVSLAAKSLAAGALSFTVDEIDLTRDRTQDGPAEQKLLSLLWKAPEPRQ